MGTERPDLAAIKARLAAATVGPLSVETLLLPLEEHAHYFIQAGPAVALAKMNGPCLMYRNAEADAEFFAHAREDIPALVAYVEHLEAERGRDIELTQGKVTLVDVADYETLAKHTWHAHYNGRVWYAQTNIPCGDGKYVTLPMHRAILGADESVLIDHRDGNGLNNRRSNLRLCDHADNSRNRRRNLKPTKYEYRGVNPVNKSQKWQANIRVNNKQVYLGCYPTKEDAARAYDDAARRHFGEFAVVNFPTPAPRETGDGARGAEGRMSEEWATDFLHEEIARLRAEVDSWKDAAQEGTKLLSELRDKYDRDTLRLATRAEAPPSSAGAEGRMTDEDFTVPAKLFADERARAIAAEHECARLRARAEEFCERWKAAEQRAGALEGALRTIMRRLLADEPDDVESAVASGRKLNDAYGFAKDALTRAAPSHCQQCGEPHGGAVCPYAAPSPPTVGECVVEIMSSRACERGTRGCEVRHPTGPA